MKQTLMAQLYMKMEAEQEQFLSELMASTPQKIVDHAYDIALRADILYAMENIELSTPQIKSLLALEKPLESIYDAWLDSDYSHMEMIEDTIEKSANLHLKSQMAASRPKAEVER